MVFMFESKENTNVRLPFGLRDIFPFESSERNAIKRIISSQFQRWGYGEVKTPVMEYTENISIGVGKDWKDKLRIRYLQDFATSPMFSVNPALR